MNLNITFTTLVCLFARHAAAQSGYEHAGTQAGDRGMLAPTSSLALSAEVENPLKPQHPKAAEGEEETVSLETDEETVSLKNVKAPSSNLKSSFRCANGSIKLYSAYEFYPKTAGGTACIGGSGGSPFYMHSYKTTVRTLRVWWGHGSPYDGFKAIQVEYFNDKTATKGGVPSSGPDASFTFKAGEFIQGSIVLGGNGHGTRTGYLYFKTNLGRKFTAGNLHTPYYLPATGSLLAGFFGNSANDIDHLGIYLFKPISKLEIYGVDYPTLDSYLAGLTPTSIMDRPYCNNTPSNQGEIREVTVTHGSSENWSLSTTASFEMTVGISVTAGVPEVFGATTNTQYKWGISTTGSYSMTQDTKTTVKEQFSFIYPAQTKGRHTITQFDSNINVPWEGAERITFTDGSSMVIAVKGEYAGVYVSSTRHVYDSTPCDPCDCSDYEGDETKAVYK